VFHILTAVLVSCCSIDKHLCDAVSIQNGLNQDVLSPLFLNLALGYAMKKGQGSQEGLEMNGALQLLFCADNVSILGENINTLQKNTEAVKSLVGRMV